MMTAAIANGQTPPKMKMTTDIPAGNHNAGFRRDASGHVEIFRRFA